MNLHPNDRPNNVEDFRDALIGSRPVTIPTSIQIPTRSSYSRFKREIPYVVALLGMSLLTLLLTVIK